MGLNFPDSPTAGDNFPTSPIAGIPTYSWDGEKWVVIISPTGGGGGGVPEAPTDGVQYGRQNGAWTRSFQIPTYQTIYVATTGSDANPGTSGSPVQTLSRGVALASQLCMGGTGNSVICQLANGTYTAGATINGILNMGVNGLIINGSSTPGAVVLADVAASPGAIIADNNAFVLVQGMTITSAHGSALFPQHGATIVVGTGMTFGAAHFGHFHAETGGRVEILSSYTVNGGAPAHLEAVLGGQIIYLETAITVTVTGTPNFSSAFVDLSVNSLAYVNASFITFSGAATGALYRLRDNSSIETVSGVPTNFPGNALGVISRGGVFNPPLDPFLTAVSGLGTGGTAIISATTPAGAVQLNTGASGAAATGTFTINLREAAPSGIAASFTGSVGSQFWNAAATFLCGGGTNSSVTVNWNNNGIALTASSTYYVQYQITPY